MAPTTHPRVLQVKHAYRKLCLKHHPDLCAPGERAEAERVFKHLTEAYSRALAGTSGNGETASELKQM